jgi:hypothetical protein
VKVGAIEKTRLPEPVSFEIESMRYWLVAVVVALDCASVKSTLLALWLESFKIPEIVVEESDGAVPNTTDPLPVSFVSEFARKSEVAVVVARWDASTKSALLAVCAERVRIPESESPAAFVVPVKVGPAERTNDPHEPVVFPERIAASSEQVLN